MLLEVFRPTVLAVTQIFLLGAVGYFLVRKTVLGDEALDFLSRLTIEITLPALILAQLIKDFSFSLYPNWWLFPLLSIAITVLGLGLGFIFSFFIHGHQHKAQFLSLVGFQNSGYLPLVLIAAILPKDQSSPMFIFLFLFLLGFNLTMWSVSTYILSSSTVRKFEMGTLFSPPVVAALLGLATVFFGLNKFVPEFILRPLSMVGDCTLPLSMFVVGASLAQIKLIAIDRKAIFLIILAKLVIMPLLGLLLLIKFHLGYLFGLLVILQLAVPCANSLSVIIRHYKKEDLLVSQGIFYSHIASLITIPIFLSLYFMFCK